MVICYLGIHTLLVLLHQSISWPTEAGAAIRAGRTLGRSRADEVFALHQTFSQRWVWNRGSINEKVASEGKHETTLMESSGVERDASTTEAETTADQHC